MNRLKNNILKELNKNKFKVRKNGKNQTKLTIIPSLAFMILLPIIIVLLLNKMLSFNVEFFLFLFILSLFCGFYNIFKTISDLYKQPTEIKND